MPDTTNEMLASKKFRAAVVATIVGIAAHFGLHVSDEFVAIIMSPFIAYITAQGIADHGSTAAQVTAKATDTTTATATVTTTTPAEK